MAPATKSLERKTASWDRRSSILCSSPSGRSLVQAQYPYSEITTGLPGNAACRSSKCLASPSRVPGYQVPKYSFVSMKSINPAASLSGVLIKEFEAYEQSRFGSSLFASSNICFANWYAGGFCPPTSLQRPQATTEG